MTLLALAERQRGYVRVDDARLLGISRKLRSRWLREHEWERVGPRLLHRTGVPVDTGARIMRCVLDIGVGAVASVGCAAAWWGLPGFDPLRISVTRPRGIRGSEPYFPMDLHEVVDLGPDQVTVLDGIPIVRPERLAFELFASTHPLRAARAVETMWSKRLLSGASLRATFEELAGRGRKGTVAMRAFLESHPVEWVPPASNLEARFAAIVSAAGLGQWHRQVDVGESHWVGRVDFLHDRLPVIVEVQSERYHHALLDRAADAARRRALEAAGFTVVEVWDTQIWHDRWKVVAAVRAALNAARPHAAA